MPHLVSTGMSPRARALVTAGEGGLLALGEPLERAARFLPGDSAHSPGMPELTQCGNGSGFLCDTKAGQLSDRRANILLMRPALKPGLLPVWRNRDTVQI